MVKVTDKDHGAKALVARLQKAIPSGRVGVYGDLAAQKHKDSPRATVGQIAAHHEFAGRSWMRSTLAERRDQITRGLGKVCLAAFNGKDDPAQMMRQLALAAAGWCKERITAGIPPALKEPYLSRKLAKYPGATTPLIASSQMLGSITGDLES